MSVAVTGENGEILGVDEREFSTYGEFGLEFFRRAVSIERIRAGVSGLTGKPVEFGPIGAGPARIAKINAVGQIGDPEVARTSDDEPLRFLLSIPVDLRFTVKLPATEHRFEADVVIELTLTARAGAPLRVIIDIEPPKKNDIKVKLQGGNIASTVLQLVSGMDGEIKRFLARYIAKEIDKSHIREARDVDVGRYIDGTQHRV